MKNLADLAELADLADMCPTMNRVQETWEGRHKTLRCETGDGSLTSISGKFSALNLGGELYQFLWTLIDNQK